MTSEEPMTSTQASAAYAALRHGGASAGRASLELALSGKTATRLESLFLHRSGDLRPKFARHDRHVTSVLRAGGYPVLPERVR
jgi:hypothetical protein